MDGHAAAPGSPGFKDRTLGLVLFGVVEILIGLLCALLIPITLIVGAATRALGGPGASPDLRTTVPGLLMYGAMAVAFVWLGVGSISCRRWARELILVASWLWLITGVVAVLVSWWLLPVMWGGLAVSSGLPSEGLAAVMVATTLLLGLVYVALPGAFVLFYRSPHVAATCRARDPEPSWVDDCPPHILSLALIFALCALSALVMPAYDFVLPLFGVVLTGVAGAVGWGLVLTVLVILMWGTARRDPRAWWLALAASLFGVVATTVTAAKVPFSDLLAPLGLPADQTALIEQVWSLGPLAMVIASLATWVSFMAYLLYTKRFFRHPERPD
jgi:hypothetical protein